MARNRTTLEETTVDHENGATDASLSTIDPILTEPDLQDVASPSEGAGAGMEAFDEGTPIVDDAGDGSDLPGVEPLPEYQPISILTPAPSGGAESSAMGGEEDARDADYGSRTGEQEEFFSALATALPYIVQGGKMVSKIPAVRKAGNRVLRQLGLESAAYGGADGASSLLEVVLGVDDRVRIANTTVPPWNGICQLNITSRTGQRFTGTGWLIAPRTIITAGHCVYLHGAGGWAASIEVSAGRNGTSFPFGRIRSTTFRALTAWTRDRNRNYDYGCIILPSAPRMSGRLPFCFNFAALGDAAIRARALNLSGYPGDKGGTTQWFHARGAKSLTPHTITYDIDTAGGQSGSPVWQLANGVRTAVGIHTNGSPLGNSATRITPAVAAMMQGWKALGAA